MTRTRKPVTTSDLLKKADIKPKEPVLLITAEESLENILEAVEEYCPSLRINKITANDLKPLLSSYSNCVINYHPENYHQERAALLENIEMLKRYGLTDDDYNSLDFY